MTYTHVPLDSRTGSWASGPVIEAAAVDERLKEAWDLPSLTLAGEPAAQEGPPDLASVGRPRVADSAWTQLLAAVEEWPPGASVPRWPDKPEIIQSSVEPVLLLRRWTGLPMADLGALLGVSRRTLYDWLRGVQPQIENRERIGRLVEIIGALATSAPPDTIAAWLRQHARPAHAGPIDVDVLATAARQSIGGDELPNLERIEGALEGAHVSALETDELKAVLERRALARPAIEAQAWQPREIMPATDNEA